MEIIIGEALGAFGLVLRARPTALLALHARAVGEGEAVFAFKTVSSEGKDAVGDARFR